MKKVICLILALLLSSMIISASATEATSGTCGENSVWTYQDGTLTISGTGKVERENYLSPWKPHISGITTVVVEEGITELGDGCFTSHKNLVSIFLPDSLTAIGAQNFQDCNNLTHVTIPKNVTSLGNPRRSSYAANVFSGTNLTAIHVDKANKRFYDIDGVLFDQKENALLCYPRGKANTAYTVPDGIEVIFNNAFHFCPMSTVTLPESLTTIGDWAFYAAKITALRIPNNVTSIGRSTFANCDQMREITIPKTVDALAQDVFGSCEKLERLTIMNPNCRFAQNSSVITTNVTLYGYAGSTAESYARQYGKDFVDIETGTHIYHSPGNAGYVALLPKNPGGSTPAFNGAIMSNFFGDIQGYQPNLVIVRDKTDPTYLEMLAFVQQLTADVTTDYEKAQKISQWVSDNMTYQFGYFGSGNTPEGCYQIWKNRIGNCEGYTQLTNFLLHLAHIPNATVVGYGHCWSAALVEGRWIMIDSTNRWFDPDPNALGEILRIDFSVNGNLMCVIDDLTGVKLACFGESIQNRYLETELTIPAYINYFYSTAFIFSNDPTPVIHGKKGSYAELFVRDYLTDYNYLSYSGDTFTAEVRENYIPHAAILTGTSFSLSFEDCVRVNLYYTAENTQDVVEQGMLVFYEDPGVADFSKASEIQKSEYSASRDRHMASSYGIPAKEMGDERYYCAYARLTDGTYVYSKLYGYSPKQYAMNRLERSDDDALKALCAAMLNYGAAAQEYFGYRTDNLMNKDLTDAQKALVKAYDESLFTGAVAVAPPEFADFSSTNSGFSYKRASVSFDGTFGINYYLMPTGDVQGSMLIYIWGSGDTTLIEEMQAVENGAYWGCFGGIAPKELDDTFYMAAVYTDSHGNTHCTGVIPYSISTYCMNTANSETMGALSQATAMYGYYAKEYFSK